MGVNKNLNLTDIYSSMKITILIRVQIKFTPLNYPGKYKCYSMLHILLNNRRREKPQNFRIQRGFYS